MLSILIVFLVTFGPGEAADAGLKPFSTKQVTMLGGSLISPTDSYRHQGVLSCNQLDTLVFAIKPTSACSTLHVELWDVLRAVEGAERDAGVVTSHFSMLEEKSLLRMWGAMESPGMIFGILAADAASPEVFSAESFGFGFRMLNESESKFQDRGWEWQWARRLYVDIPGVSLQHPYQNVLLQFNETQLSSGSFNISVGVYNGNRCMGGDEAMSESTVYVVTARCTATGALPCPQNCSLFNGTQRGDCVNGVCQCRVGYGGAACNMEVITLPVGRYSLPVEVAIPVKTAKYLQFEDPGYLLLLELVLVAGPSLPLVMIQDRDGFEPGGLPTPFETYNSGSGRNDVFQGVVLEGSTSGKKRYIGLLNRPLAGVSNDSTWDAAQQGSLETGMQDVTVAVRLVQRDNGGVWDEGLGDVIGAPPSSPEAPGPPALMNVTMECELNCNAMWGACDEEGFCHCESGIGGRFCDAIFRELLIGRQVAETLRPRQWGYFSFELRGRSTFGQLYGTGLRIQKTGGQPVLVLNYLMTETTSSRAYTTTPTAGQTTGIVLGPDDWPTLANADFEFFDTTEWQNSTPYVLRLTTLPNGRYVLGITNLSNQPDDNCALVLLLTDANTGKASLGLYLLTTVLVVSLVVTIISAGLGVRLVRLNQFRRRRRAARALSMMSFSRQLGMLAEDSATNQLENSGVPEATLRTLPLWVFGAEELQKRGQVAADPICVVCLVDYKEGDQLRELPTCAHSFHVACVDTWLATHSTCPTCRVPLVPTEPSWRSTPTSNTDSGAGGAIATTSSHGDVSSSTRQPRMALEVSRPGAELGGLSMRFWNLGWGTPRSRSSRAQAQAVEDSPDGASGPSNDSSSSGGAPRRTHIHWLALTADAVGMARTAVFMITGMAPLAGSVGSQGPLDNTPRASDHSSSTPTAGVIGPSEEASAAGVGSADAQAVSVMGAGCASPAACMDDRSCDSVKDPEAVKPCSSVPASDHCSEVGQEHVGASAGRLVIVVDHPAEDGEPGIQPAWPRNVLQAP